MNEAEVKTFVSPGFANSTMTTPEEKDRFVELMRVVAPVGELKPITSDITPTEPEKTPERLELEAKLTRLNAEAKQTITTQDIEDITGSTIKRDNTNKIITFLCMTLNYTSRNQTNIGYLAEASTGKSYIPLELANGYFPSEDVVKIGYASPTSFFHDLGDWVTDPRDKRDVEDEKKRKIIKIDLAQKIIIFMDQPDDHLLQRLRSFFSHDEREITYKISDHTQKSGLRTKTIVLKGFPTVIFCSAKFTMHDQEKTRLLLLSPQIDQEKIREAIMLKIDKEGDIDAYNARVQNDPRRQMLAERISQVKSAHIKEVKISEDLRQEIYDRFIETRKYAIPRHTRDISRLLCIIQGYALLNFPNRERKEDCIYINEEDVLVGFQLYTNISEANELGLSPELFNIYEQVSPIIRLATTGVDRKEFQKIYYETFHKILGREGADNVLKAFETCGLLTSMQDQLDKRVIKYVLPDMGYTPKPSSTEDGDTPPPATHSLEEFPSENRDGVNHE